MSWQKASHLKIQSQKIKNFLWAFMHVMYSCLHRYEHQYNQFLDRRISWLQDAVSYWFDITFLPSSAEQALRQRTKGMLYSSPSQLPDVIVCCLLTECQLSLWQLNSYHLHFLQWNSCLLSVVFVRFFLLREMQMDSVVLVAVNYWSFLSNLIRFTIRIFSFSWT